MNAIQKLKKYGLVKSCKVVRENVVTIVITNGFNDSATNTCLFLKDCRECFPEHPILVTLITEQNFAMVVLASA